MKKFLCLLLALALLCGALPPERISALSEEEAVSELAETPEEPVASEGFALTPEDPAVEEVSEAEPEEAPAEAAEWPRYAVLCQAVTLDGAALAAGDYALAISPAGENGLLLAVHTPAGVVTGEAPLDAVELLTSDALEECLNALAQMEGVTLYEGNIDLPLPECAPDVQPKDGRAPANIYLIDERIDLGVGEVCPAVGVIVTDAEGMVLENAPVTWYVSSGTKYVSADPDTGAIKGLKKGSGVIQAVAAEGVEATLRVTVMKAPSRVTVTPDSAKLSPGDTVDLNVSFGKNTTSAVVKFKSSNDAVATVDADGHVTATGKGQAIIRATAFNGKYGDARVTVYGAPAALSIASKEYSLVAGGSVTLSATALDSDGEATPAKLSYAIDDSSPDPECVFLEEDTGRVTALERGSAILRISAGDVSDTCLVKVVPAPADLALSQSRLTLGVKETWTGITATLVPPEGESECQSEITWRSSSARIARVDASTGAITGVKAGSATIYARTHNGIERSVAVTVKKAPKAITLSPAELTLSPGGTARLTAAASGETASARFSYTTSNASVAQVSDDGVVTALSRGTATITAASFNGKKAACRVTVLNDPVRLWLDDESLSLAQGMSQTLTVHAEDAEGAPAMAVYQWSVDCPEVVSVDDSGKVTALSAGSAVVTVSAGALTASCAIDVVAAPADIQPSKTSLTLGVKETLPAIDVALIPPEGEADCAATLTWRSSNTRYVQVDPETGAITGAKAGSATIYVRTQNGLERSISVTVKKAPSRLTLTPSTLTLSVGMNASLKARTNDKSASATLKAVSNDPAVATVDSNGIVTALSSGTAVINVTTYNGKSASCRVTVYGTPDTVVLDEDNLKLSQGLSAVLSARALDGSGKAVPILLNYAVDPSSADPGCVSVDAATGQVTGLRGGSAVVRVSAGDSVYALCAVSVVPAPADMRLETTSVTLGVNETLAGPIPELIPPEGQDDCEAVITWSSDKAKVVKVDAKTGRLTGAKAGTTTVRARTHNGIERTVKVTVMKAPSSVTLTPSAVTVSEDMTVQLTASASTVSNTFNYQSSAPSVAEVDSDGLVHALSEGKASITVSTYNGRKATCTVTVQSAPATIALEQTALDMMAGETFQLTPTALSRTGSQSPATFTYAVTGGCVSVDERGLLTALEGGTATVTVSTQNGVTAEITVNVKDAPVRVTVNEESIALGVGEVYEGLSAMAIPPEGAGDCADEIEWSVSDPAIVRLKDGTLTALSQGTATLTATARNGLSACVTVTVKAAPKRLILSPEALSLTTGASRRIAASAEPGAYARSVTYASADPTVATVDADGTVHAVATGTTVITATAYNGVSGSCTITVTGAPAQVFLPERLTLAVGMSQTVEITALDAAGALAEADGTLNVLEGADVISLDGRRVTAIGEGTAVIGVTTINGISEHIDANTGSAVATLCAVTVSPAVGRIELPDISQLKVGGTASFAPVLYDTSGNVTDIGDYTLSVSGDALALDADDRATGLRMGTATITATAYNGVSAAREVQVYTPRYRYFAAYEYQNAKSGALTFPMNNAQSVWTVLSRSRIDGVGYTESIMANPSKAALRAGLESTFKDSMDTDVNVVYLCSHGNNYINVDPDRAVNTHYGLQLPGYKDHDSKSEYYITSEEIFAAMRAIKGKVVLILDSCFSGVFIDDMRSALDAENGRISVMTAATNTKASYRYIANAGEAYDFFTYYLLLGAQYNMAEHQNVTAPGADTNGDGALSVSELFNFARLGVINKLSSLKAGDFEGDANQKPRLYAGANGDLILYQ